MRPAAWIPFAYFVVGCAASQTRATQPEPPAPPPPPSVVAEAPPPNTREVSGPGWTARVPNDWTESQGESGTTQWQGVIREDRAERRVLSVVPLRAPEPFEQIVAEVPAAYRARGSTAEEPRIFDHRGRRAAEVLVNQPAQAQRFPMYMAILVEGRRGLVVSCGGEPGDDIEGLCHRVIDSAWFGAGDARPRAAAPEGMSWVGTAGRYVQAPAGWQPLAAHSDEGRPSVGVADAGEHHAIVLHLLDDLEGPAATAIEGGRRGFEQDAANTIVHTRPIRAGRRTGLFIEGTRSEPTRAATTLFQWIVPAGPGEVFTVNVAGPTDDVAANQGIYRAVLESFTPTR